MKWVTRAYVHLDRVASPWLIVRFIDPQAQFEFVPWGEEASRSTDAIGFALPGATYGPHDAQGTTFAKLRRAHHLDDPALVTLEQVIGHGVEYVLHGFRPAADDRLGQIAVGLLAIAEGLLLTHRDDNAIIAQSLPFYDALYAQFKVEHAVETEGLVLPGHGDGRGPTSKIDFLRTVLDKASGKTD